MTQESFSYADYQKWSGDRRWEIVDGEAFMMTGPALAHQEILLELAALMKSFFNGKPCKLIVAPFDVLLPVGNESEELVKTIVQPDLMVVCDEKKLRKAFCFGAPDLVIEILSPSTMSHDNICKRRLYERHGVKELWIIHPESAIVWLYIPDKDRTYQLKKIYGYDDCLESSLFPKLKIELSIIFPPPPKKEVCSPPTEFTRL